MGKMKKLSVLPVAVGVLLLLYVIYRAGASLSQGYSWQEMDWQQRGSTSISDFFRASDIGKRETQVNGKPCIEYYAYKDALAVKTVCPK